MRVGKCLIWGTMLLAVIQMMITGTKAVEQVQMEEGEEPPKSLRDRPVCPSAIVEQYHALASETDDGKICQQQMKAGKEPCNTPECLRLLLSRANHMPSNCVIPAGKQEVTSQMLKLGLVYCMQTKHEKTSLSPQRQEEDLPPFYKHGQYFD